MSKLVVEEQRGAAALEALRPEWQALFSASGAPPFLSWEWMSAWQQSFGDNKTPRLLGVRAGGTLVGLLPLIEEEQHVLGFAKLRRLSFLGAGEGAADYLDVLAQPGSEYPSADAIFAYLTKADSFDLLALDDLAGDSPSLPFLIRHFGENANFRFQLSPKHICPQIKIAGTWDEMFKRKERARNFTRRLRHMPSFERREVSHPDVIDAAFDRFLALHEAYWAERGGSDATRTPLLKSFHRAAAIGLAKAGQARFEEIWIDGACRGSLYGMGSNERYCFYQSAWDPAWADHSLGLVMCGLSISHAVERRVKCFDFLRGSEAFKFDWANSTRVTVAVKAAGPNASARLALAHEQGLTAARNTAHAILPDRAIEWLRRRRRAHRLVVGRP